MLNLSQVVVTRRPPSGSNYHAYVGLAVLESTAGRCILDTSAGVSRPLGVIISAEDLDDGLVSVAIDGTARAKLVGAYVVGNNRVMASDALGKLTACADGLWSVGVLIENQAFDALDEADVVIDIRQHGDGDAAEAVAAAAAIVAAALLASSANGEGASLIGVEDAGGLLVATEVEGALAEIETEVQAGTTAAGLNTDYRTTTVAGGVVAALAARGLSVLAHGNVTILAAATAPAADPDLSAAGPGATSLDGFPVMVTQEQAAPDATAGAPAYSWSGAGALLIRSIATTADTVYRYIVLG